MNRPEPREMLVTQTFNVTAGEVGDYVEGEDYFEPMYRCDEADPFMDWQRARITELEAALGSVLGYIPDGWMMPWGFDQIASQARAALKGDT